MEDLSGSILRSSRGELILEESEQEKAPCEAEAPPNSRGDNKCPLGVFRGLFPCNQSWLLRQQGTRDF